jgi:MerR family transcriptional regulator, aldehyde-responsive regulator
MERNIYLIKDLAYVTGYSVDTLKFYLKIGLMQEVSRGIETNFRFFDDSTVERLSIIRDLRKDGMSLESIKLKMEKIDRMPR